MSSAWGLIGANNRGWYGSGTRVPSYRNTLPPAPEPPVFNPLTDISNCVLWLDANDTSTIQVNGDLSGANVNRVMKWFDKAQPSNQNYYSHSGNPAGSGLYNTHYMNQLNTVYFEPDAFMTHQGQGVTFNFQDRTFFAVVKPLTDLSGTATPFLSIFNGYEIGDMNTTIGLDVSGYYFVMCENQIQCGIGFLISGDILNHRMIVMAVQSSTDLSGNAGALDTVYQTLLANALGTQYNTAQSQYYLNDPNKGTGQDIAEIIMYSRVLTNEEQIRVNDYLADKWNLSGSSESGANNPNIYNNNEPPIQQLPEVPEVVSWYPTYGYAIYGQFLENESPNWFWCDEFGNVESPPVLILNFDGYMSTGERDDAVFMILGVFYA